jgi:heterodisulfide reductase subunit C/nitrate reductase gamma subunit
MTATQVAFIILTLISFGFFGFTIYRLAKIFRLTKPEFRFDHIGERMVTTFMVAFGQTKMMKRPVAGILHAFVWWGFLVVTIGSLEMMIDGITGSTRALSALGPFYSFVTASGDIFALLIIVSCVIFLWRRYVIKPRRFKGIEMKPSSRADATFILSLILILMVTLLGMNTAYIASDRNDYTGSFPVSYYLTPLFSSTGQDQLLLIEKICWWIHITIIYFFLNFLPYSKHFHVIASVPNVFFTRMEPYAKLTNMESVTREVKLMLNMAEPGNDVATPQRFGVKDVEDVTWKTLLDSYTCTECGRCTAVCPANITGKLLSPRKLFVDLRRRAKDKAPGIIKTGSSFSDGKAVIGPDYITEEELWACTTCMACIEECPVDIDHVPFIIDMRRNLVMEESKAPSQLAVMFSNIENNGAPWAFARQDRFNWAYDIEIKSATNN